MESIHPDHPMRQVQQRHLQIELSNPRFHLRLEKNIVAAITTRVEAIEGTNPFINRHEFMVCRMFHPTNGRNNFEDLTCNDIIERKHSTVELETKTDKTGLQRLSSTYAAPSNALPDEIIVVRMLRREMELRKRDDNQHAVGLDGQNSVEINRQIQLQVVREFGFPDDYIRVIQCARFLYPRNPLMKSIQTTLSLIEVKVDI